VNYNFVKGQFTEAQLEKAIIALFEQQDYTYVHGEISIEKTRIFCSWMTCAPLCCLGIARTV